MVTSRPESRNFLLESLNPEHPPYTFPAEDILEFWKFHSYTSGVLPEPESDLKTLTNLVLDLKNDLAILKHR